MVKDPSDTSHKISAGSSPEVERAFVHNNPAETDSREQLIAELREAVRVRDDFLAIAAHELRNPLTPILICVQLIRGAEQAGDSVKTRTELDRLDRLLKHFVARTTTLLEVAQISSNKLQLKLSELNLSELTRRIVNDYAPLIVRGGCELTTNIQDGVTAHLDELAISEIVENLLSNAIKYGERRPIELTLTADEGLAQIVIRDNGIGIDRKDQKRIFERFEQVVRPEGHSGFGIGLWLTRNLTESMGGSITVVGKPGAGSEFTVTLPIKPQENR